MFPYSLYKVVHIVGILLLAAGLSGVAFSAEAASGRPGTGRRFAFILHGGGLFLVLLGGFGMLARLGFGPDVSWPGWIWAKVIIWVTLGAAALLPFRFPRTARPVLLALPLLGGLAAYMAIYKPF